MIVSPDDLLYRGLFLIGEKTEGRPKHLLMKTFTSHYGSEPIALAKMWTDLVTIDIPGVTLTEKEKGGWGLERFLRAHYFLYVYPRSAEITKKTFDICLSYSQGEHMWKWVRCIAALKQIKIVWDESLNVPHLPLYVCTLDGTDFKINESHLHPTEPVDKGLYSHKFNHGAVKYEIALSVFEPKCVWINGPHRGGKHDLSILREGGLLDKIALGDLVIADRGYRTSAPHEERKFSLPNPLDTYEVAAFKARASARHEAFNKRLKNYRILYNTYQHDVERKHQWAFEAVVVSVQYQMENGHPIFDVQ